MNPSDAIARELVSEEEIRERVAGLAEQIQEDFRGSDLVVVGLLTGTLMFLADLVRKIDLPMRLDFIGVSSYRDGTESTELVFTKELRLDVRDRDVLLVDDILDIVATDEQLGKPAGNDLIEGIYTLPVIHALADDAVATDLRPLLTRDITLDQRDRARELIRASSGVRTALDVAQGWADKAAGTLTDLPDTPGARALRAASDDLIARAHAPLS